MQEILKHTIGAEDGKQGVSEVRNKDNGSTVENDSWLKSYAGITKPIVKRKAKEGERIVIMNPHLSGNVYGPGDVFEVVEVIFRGVMVNIGGSSYPIKDEEYEVIIEMKTEKNDSPPRVAKKKDYTMILPQSTEILNTGNEKSEAVRYIEKTSRLFSRLYAKHGDYFFEEYKLHHHVMLKLFTAMPTQDIRRTLRLPNNIFKGCLEKELTKRRSKAKALRARGRLRRMEARLCLI